MLKILKFCVVLTLSSVLVGCASSSKNLQDTASTDVQSVDTPQEALALGDKALLNNKTEEALQYYVRALDLNPKNTEALLRIGTVQQNYGNPDLAIKAYDMLLATMPRHAGALEAVGLIYLDQRKYDLAEWRLRAAISADSKRWQALNGMGLIADERKQHEAAIRYFESALIIQPQSAQLLNNRGYSKYLLGHFADAESDFRRALQLDAKNERANHNLGLVLARQGQAEAALAAFRQTMDEASAYNNIGYIYLMAGKYAEAQDFLQKAIVSSPTYNAQAHENLSHLYDVWQE